MAVELTYFNMSGLGEPVRVMLSFGEIEFVDNRVEKEEWAKLKSEMTFGKLPRLKIDGFELYQSRAICRYIAGKLNLRGKSPRAAAEADMWVDTIDDVRAMVARWYYQPDSTERTENLEKMTNTELPQVFSVIETLLEKANSKFLVDNQLSWADVMMFGYLFYISELLSTSADSILAGRPRLLGIYATIKNSPGIQKWLQTRPPSPPDMRSLFR